MDLSALFSQCHAYTARRSTVDLLPNKQPAVYGFYDLFRFSETQLPDDVDAFKTRHARKLTVKEGEFPDLFRVISRGNPEAFKGEGLKLCKALDVPSLTETCRILAFLSFLNEPLYVGKTSDVKARFTAHHDNGFLYKMKDVPYKRPAEEFLFFAFFCEEKYVRAIESILIQLINPPFCDQKT